MLHYTAYKAENNSKKWITFVHGAGGSSSIWFNQVRYFKAFFNIILIDLRGHGKSDNSPEGLNYSFELIINDLIQVLLNFFLGFVGIQFELHHSHG